MSVIEIVQPTITKSHPGMTTGIRVKYEYNSKALVISHVSEASPFYGILPQGYYLIAINEDSSITSVNGVIEAIKACQSTVKITAVSIPVPAGLCRLATVKNASSITDVRFESTQTHLVRVANISNSPGPFSNSPIEQGDIILSIKNKVMSNPLVAAQLLQDIRDATTASILFVPVSRLQRQAIYGSAPRLGVTEFTPIVPNKTYTLELLRCPRYPWKVEFVDFYNFQFKESWLQFRHLLDLERGDERRFLAIMPVARVFNETMMDSLCRLDNLVGFYSNSQGTPDLTVTSSLEMLADLKSRNLLTDEEFRAAKAKVLGLIGDKVVYALPSQEATVVGIVEEEEEESVAPSESLLGMLSRTCI